MYSFTRKGILALLLLAVPVCLVAQSNDLVGPDAPAEDMVETIIFRDDSTDQILTLLERLTGRSVIRPQALPAATFTFNSQRAMTRDEAILALQSLLSINGIGVSPMGDLFLKVVPLSRVRSEAPEFLNSSTLDLPASGRIVSRMLQLDFLSIDEIQTQLNLMITAGSGSIIPFPKANALLVTDTVSNIQSIEKLLQSVDRPATPRIETHFYPVRYARAGELVNQIQGFAGTAGFPEMSGRTSLVADERSNQIILIADRRQVPYYENLIKKLDVQAELITQNEVIFLKYADAVDVASILSQLAGRTGAAGARAGTATRTGQQTGQRATTGQRPQAGTQTGQRTQTGTGQRIQTGTPPVPGQTRAQSADVFAQQNGEGAGAGLSIDAAERALGDVTEGVNGSDFSESLSILPDERSNAIIISGTRQDIALITSLIEKIDVILAQVRIEVFIAEVTLSDSDGRGIDRFEIGLTEWGSPDFTVSGPGYQIARDGVDWEALFTTARSKSEIKVLSNPTIVTTHNREATIVVGESRPVITGTLTDGQFSSSIRSQVRMMDIAIELRVKPLIGADGTIQLEIFQKVDDRVDSVTIDGNEQPVIGRREAESFVSVANRETVILGGLQSTRREDSSARLGILGQIPLLGGLFGSKNQEERRTELLVFIRPTVLPTTRAAFEDAERQIDRQSRNEYIRHKMDPENHPSPDVKEEEEASRPRVRRGTGAGGRL